MPKHQRDSRKSRSRRSEEGAPYESGEILEDGEEPQQQNQQQKQQQSRHAKQHRQRDDDHRSNRNKPSDRRRNKSSSNSINSAIDTPCTTFDDMNLKPDLLKGVYAYGFEKPSAIQQRAIKPIVLGRDVIAQSQSGTGKTAVFSIASLQLLDETSRDVQVLVISPTRELAEQSQRVMQSLGDFMNVSTVHSIVQYTVKIYD